MAWAMEHMPESSRIWLMVDTVVSFNPGNRKGADRISTADPRP